MKIAQQLKAKNIAEYLIYMWQVEDLIRANECDIDKIRENIISCYPEEEHPALEEWYGNLVDMMRTEGVKEKGHLQINRNVIVNLTELHVELLASPKYPYYSAAYFKALPFIVELRGKTKRVADTMARKGDDQLKQVAATLGHSEIETCFDLLYGVMMLRLQQKEVTAATTTALKEVSTFIGMLSDYYIKDKTEGLDFGEQS